MKTIPTVTITSVSPRWSYFQVFILGLYELERQGKIVLRFRTDPFFLLSTKLPENPFVVRVISHFNRKYTKDSYLLTGNIRSGRIIKTFCIDCADAPYLFDSEQLASVDVYFKMQCPKEIDSKKGFRLADGVYVPYCDHKHSDPSLPLTVRSPRKEFKNLDLYVQKIKPLAVGFRRLSYFNSYKSLKSGYDSYRLGAAQISHKKLMCYFGNALGPEPEKNVTTPDLDWERDIMGRFAGTVSHPNEKRAKVSEFINSLGEGYDGRIISEGFADGTSLRHEELVVPLKDFCSFVADFQYNMNVSGYRLSIPNRFMESFVVGTAIVTDALSVKWYLPFGPEVMETARMGYEKQENVDWDKVRRDLSSLPEVDKKTVLDEFDRKWSPSALASYLVNTVLGL